MLLKIILRPLFLRCQLLLTKNDSRGSRLYAWPSLTLHLWESCLELNRVAQNQNTSRGNTTCQIKPIIRKHSYENLKQKNLIKNQFFIRKSFYNFSSLVFLEIKLP